MALRGQKQWCSLWRGAAELWSSQSLWRQKAHLGREAGCPRAIPSAWPTGASKSAHVYGLVFGVSACSSSCLTFIWNELLLSKHRRMFLFVLHYLNSAHWLLEFS